MRVFVCVRGGGHDAVVRTMEFFTGVFFRKDRQMKSRKALTATTLVAILALAGCATEKYLVPTGGDRAAGTIELSYEYGLFESPRLHSAEAIKMAKERCAAWGYTDAQPVGDIKRGCEATGMLGYCEKRVATYTFQCGAAH